MRWQAGEQSLSVCPSHPSVRVHLPLAPYGRARSVGDGSGVKLVDAVAERRGAQVGLALLNSVSSQHLLFSFRSKTLHSSVGRYSTLNKFNCNISTSKKG